jgi:hypothetical protein
MRDPFSNPFPSSDPARQSIWTMLVERDITAFLAADWSMVADDFVEDGFIGIDGKKSANPDDWRLTFPNLAAYKEEWLRQAVDFQNTKFAEDPRAAIFNTTTLVDIEINGEMALARKKFDGSILLADGTRDILKWQTVYYCRFHGGAWKISGFSGYLAYAGGQ